MEYISNTIGSELVILTTKEVLLMVKINWAHVARQDPEMWVADKDRFYPFPNTESTDPLVVNLATNRLTAMNEAIAFIQTKLLKLKSCNDCFKRLPKGRSFVDIWNDPDTWIHYNGVTGSLGFSRAGTKEIAIGSKSFESNIDHPGRPNSMQVAATIVHELAHVGGAEGDPSKRDNAAEASLKACLLGQMFKPDVFGAIERQMQENDSDTRYIV
jgi:hypothetical protein